MTRGSEVVPGVRVDHEYMRAEFDRGTLADLASGLRDVLWGDLSLFADTDILIVHVGGNRRETRDMPLEVESWQPGIPYETIEISRHMQRKFEAVRAANMPGKRYSEWACDCEEYCDEDHGEGRIDLYVARPSFHELAVALT